VLSFVDYPGMEGIAAPDMETYSKALNAGQYPLSVLAVSDLLLGELWRIPAAERIDGSRLIPLGTLADVVASLDRSREIVVHCRSGKRSADAARLLQAAGFARVSSLAGGMLRWNQDALGD
jgi:adenylyltransferase/sulfurtransferase